MATAVLRSFGASFGFRFYGSFVESFAEPTRLGPWPSSAVAVGDPTGDSSLDPGSCAGLVPGDILVPGRGEGGQQHPCSAVQHTRWCWRCLSVRDLLLLLCSFAMLSVYMSYRLTSLHLQSNPQDTASGLGDAQQRNSADHGGNQRNARDVQPARSTTLNSRLRKMLVELEEEHLRPLRESTRVVVVRGHKAAISRDLPLVSAVLAQHGWQLRAPPWFRRPSPNTGGGSAPANSVAAMAPAVVAAPSQARLNNTATGNDGGK
ncbi:hypothetical protein HPB50_017000 [Hyalomma asiaticum]|uniref:Uncharacterized protein n=1 Tax=Hyalomma asiaticum TaxID=266040 RepID=A0ACB7S1G8_HYAAI|nr:hypothetical protein HPB50_017000 [Hyalomma asiaticum]